MAGFWDKALCCCAEYATHWKFSTSNPPTPLEWWNNYAGQPPGLLFDVGSLAVNPADSSVFVATTPFVGPQQSGGNVACYEAGGSQRWSVATSTLPKVPFANIFIAAAATFSPLNDGVFVSVACEQFDASWAAYGISALTGDILWSLLDVKGGLTDLVAEEISGNVWTSNVVATQKGLLLARISADDVFLSSVSPSTGTTQWSAPAADSAMRKFYYFASNGSLIYALYGNAISSVLYSVAPTSGTLSEVSSSAGALFYASCYPRVLSDGSLVTASQSSLRRISASDSLAVQWSYPLGAGASLLSMAVDSSDNIYGIVVPANTQYGSSVLMKWTAAGSLLYRYTIPCTLKDGWSPAFYVAVNASDQTPYVGGGLVTVIS